MSETRTKRRAILVLGMHRSGTSAVTRVVNLLGAQLGDRMLSPAADNESGFWEHQDMVRIDDALLTALGREWHDLRPLPVGWMHSDPAKAARTALIKLLREQFHGDVLWAAKDPRMCLLSPLWFDVLRELEVEPSVLLVVRHPAEVAQSLQARDDLPLPQSLWLWLRYTVAAEHATRGLPRAAVGYHSLLSDWRGAMKRAAAAMRLDWPNSMEATGVAIDSFLDTSQRHHEHVADDDLPPAIQGMYTALLAAEHDGSAWTEAKRIADEYVGAEGLFELGLEAASAVSEKASPGKAAVDSELLSSLASTVLDDIPAEPAAQPQLRDVAKLYWQCGDEAFGEARVVSIEHLGMAAPTRFAFQLPEGVRPNSVRFDPSGLSGQFEVFGLRVDGIPIDDIASRVLQVHQHQLPSNGSEHVRVLGLDGDPWVSFDLRDCWTDGGDSLVIEVMCRYESVREWMRNIIDIAVVSGMSSTVQIITNAVAANLDVIRHGHDRQMQALAVHQEHIDVHVAKIQRGLLELSDRCAQQEEAIERVLTDTMAANLGMVKQECEALKRMVDEHQADVGAQVTTMTRMVDEHQARVDAQVTTIGHDLAQNVQQLAQFETVMQARLDRLQEGVAAILDNQNRNISFWSKLRRK